MEDTEYNDNEENHEASDTSLGGPNIEQLLSEVDEQETQSEHNMLSLPPTGDADEQYLQEPQIQIEEEQETIPSQTEDIITDETPMYNQMKNLEDRKQTFGSPTWQKFKNIKNYDASDEIFAKAGFFYNGNEDEVICFHCGGGLKNISQKDQPIREHMKYFPRCGYLINQYGLEVISRMTRQFPNVERPRLLPREYVKKVDKNPDYLPIPPSPTPSETLRIHQDLLRESMETDQVRKVMNMGIQREVIQEVMRRKIEQDNCYYQSIESLLNQVLPDPIFHDGSQVQSDSITNQHYMNHQYIFAH